MTERQREAESDGQLVDRSLSGDRDAFALLYDRYASLIRSVAYDTTRNLSLSQDVTQESFLRAWRDLSALREPALFCSWLVGISKRVCREQRRANRRFPQSDSDAQSNVLADSIDADEAVLTRERDQFVLDEVGRLTDKERLAIHLFYLKQQNAIEVAEILRISRSGMYALLNRALKGLAQRLKPVAPETKGSS